MKTYRVTAGFPVAEKYGLISQMRRASVSVSSNLAEGIHRSKPADRIRFIDMAIASAAELQSQAFLAADLSFIDRKVLTDLLQETEEVMSLSKGLIRYISNLQTRKLAN